MSGSEERELPEGWVGVPLSEIAETCLGKMLDAKRTAGKPLPYLRNINVRWGTFDLSDLVEMPFEPHEEDRYAIQEGDLVICEGGEPGRCAVWKNPERIMFQKALHRVRPTQATTPDYLHHHLTYDARTSRLAELFTGTTIKHLTGSSLNRYRIRLPPLNEQKRIVAKIDALTEKSREAREALEEVPVLLDKLRQSILAAAFRGDLTREWRAKNPDVEPASVLLERIRQERRKKWEEAQLAKFQAKGKLPKDDSWKKKYVEPQPVDTTDLPDLPEGWCWASLEELRGAEENSLTDGPFGSNLKTRDYIEDGYARVITLGNIGTGTFKNEKQFFVTKEKWAYLEKHHVSPGDIVVAALAEPIARACRVPEIGPALVKADCIRFAPHSSLNSDYLMNALNSPQVRHKAESVGHGVGRLRINLGELRSLPLPLAPATEQDEVVAILGNQPSLAAAVIDIAGKLSSLDSAILAKAFRGELVPQDPNDEPASVLLERIAAERVTAESNGKKPRSRRAK